MIRLPIFKGFIPANESGSKVDFPATGWLRVGPDINSSFGFDEDQNHSVEVIATRAKVQEEYDRDGRRVWADIIDFAGHITMDNITYKATGSFSRSGNDFGEVALRPIN